MKKIFFISLILLLKTNFAYSLIKVDITRGNLDPLPIAVSPLHVDPKSESLKEIKVKELGSKISEVTVNKCYKKILTFKDKLS